MFDAVGQCGEPPYEMKKAYTGSGFMSAKIGRKPTLSLTHTQTVVAESISLCKPS